MLSSVVAFCRLVTTSVSAATKAVLANLDLGDPGTDEDLGAVAEQSTEVPFYGALGVVARPRPATKDGQADAVCTRAGDAFVPIAARDLRLNAQFPSPKEGTIALVGYGGGFHSIEDTPQHTSMHVIYVPYAYTGTTPGKAHAIILDPTTGNETISIVHGDGMSVLLGSGGVVVKNAAGDAYVEVSAGGVTINGNTVVNGGATIGSPTGALPAAVAPSVIGYLSALESLLSTIAGGTVPPSTAAVTAFIAAQAATKAAIAAAMTSIA